MVGRCNHLLKVNGACVPVEQKPTAHRLQRSHVLHVGVLCLLVQDTYGVRPPYRIVVLAGDHREQVIFSQSLERGVLRTMAQMRRILATGEPAGPRCVIPRCRAHEATSVYAGGASLHAWLLRLTDLVSVRRDWSAPSVIPSRGR